MSFHPDTTKPLGTYYNPYPEVNNLPHGGFASPGFPGGVLPVEDVYHWGYNVHPDWMTRVLPGGGPGGLNPVCILATAAQSAAHGHPRPVPYQF
jgi:hypothetical protein